MEGSVAPTAGEPSAVTRTARGGRTPAVGHGLAGRAWRVLRSRRLAIYLLIALALLAMLGAMLPQQDRIGPAAYARWSQENPNLAAVAALLGLDSVYSAWWFLALFALLYTNTLACTLPQLRSALRRTVRPAALLASGRGLAAHELALTGDPSVAVAAAAEALRGRGYRVSPAAGGLVGRKGALGVWGSPLFHLGLVVILTGAAIGGLLRFSGYLEIGEGQGFVEAKQSYLQQSQGPLFDRDSPFGHGHRGFAVLLDRFTATTSNWREGIPSDMVSEVVVLEGGQEVRRAAIRINEPLEYRGLRLYQTGMYGLAPLFELALPNGTRSTGMVYLAREGHDRYVNSLYLPETSYRMTVKAQDGDPGVEVEVFERKLTVVSQRLEPGQSLKIDDATLTLKDLRHWTGLQVVDDPGIMVLYAGFGLVIFGLAVSFLVVRREIWVAPVEAPEGRALRLGGHCPRLKALFAAELEDLAEALRVSLGGGAEPAVAPQAVERHGVEVWI